MNFTINNCDYDISDFISTTLIPKIKDTFISYLDTKRLIAFDIYLNSNKLRIFGINNPKIIISSKNILLGAINNLKINRNSNNYIIEIDPNITIPKLKAKFIDIANLINYGNLGLSSYPIFDKTFNYVASIYGKLYEDYINGGN